MVEEHDDPVDAGIATRVGQLAEQPLVLLAGRVADIPESRRVLGVVLRVERDEPGVAVRERVVQGRSRLVPAGRIERFDVGLAQVRAEVVVPRGGKHGRALQDRREDPEVVDRVLAIGAVGIGDVADVKDKGRRFLVDVLGESALGGIVHPRVAHEQEHERILGTGSGERREFRGLRPQRVVQADLVLICRGRLELKHLEGVRAAFLLEQELGRVGLGPEPDPRLRRLPGTPADRGAGVGHPYEVRLALDCARRSDGLVESRALRIARAAEPERDGEEEQREDESPMHQTRR